MVSDEESVPRKGIGYIASQSLFFAQFNDVDFYVEDEGKQNFYFVILSKLFSEISFERIYPLGGKQHLIRHAQQPNEERKSV
jgi:hypothetical protein